MLLMYLCVLVTFVGMYQLELASSGIVALIVFLLLEFVAIFVHELGHAVAVKRRGFTLEAISILWWEYDFRTRNFGSARETNDGDVGGFVIYSFDEEREPTRRDDAVIAAAGPAANMLLALIAFIAAFSLSATTSSSGGPDVSIIDAPITGSPTLPTATLPSEAIIETTMARYDAQRRREAVTHWFEGAATVLGVLSLVMGFINLIPFRGSDGDRLWWALSRKRGLRGSS